MYINIDKESSTSVYTAAGFSETIDSFNRKIAAFSQKVEQTSLLVERIYTLIETITKITGIRTIVFVIFLFLLCAGIAPTGLVKGKSVFILSVIILDVCWFYLLGVYYNSQSELISDVIQANLVVMVPFAFLSFIKILPFIAGRIQHLVNGSTVTYKKIEQTLDKFSELSPQLSKMLIYEMKEHSAKENTEAEKKLRPETTKKIKTTIHILQKLLEKSE